MKKNIINIDKPEPLAGPQIVYLCKGVGAPCYLVPYCVYREEPVAYPDEICKHNTVPEYAKNGTCEDPENHPERFEFYDELIFRDGIYYDGSYWEVEKNEQC